MLRNYFKIAFRNLWRNRFYTFINVIGLALGVTCACIIYVYVRYERNFDAFHSNADRIYRVVEHSRKMVSNTGIQRLTRWQRRCATNFRSCR